MSSRASTSTAGSRYVDAYRASGTSPGRAGRARASLSLDRAGTHEVDITYEVHGPAGHEPVIVLGGISADRHLAPTPERPEQGWWRGVVGLGGGLDPARQRLVGLDYLGGPQVHVPETGPVTSHDQARAVVAVLDDLGASTARVVGASYGGLVALALAERFPERVSKLVVLCAAHRAHPMATGIRAIQRSIVRLGQQAGREEEAVIIARALAMTTYRSATEFEQRFDVAPLDDSLPPRFPVEEYLEARGVSFASRFDAAAFYRLSESIDLHRVEPERIVVPTTLVSVDTDVLAPPWILDELRERAPGVRRHVKLESLYGHDAFLKEVDAVSDLLRAELIG